MNRRNYFNLCKILLIFIVHILAVQAHNLDDTLHYTILNNNQLQIAKKKLEITILEKPKVITEFFPNIYSELSKQSVNSNNQNFLKESLSFIMQQDIFTGGSTIAKLATVDASINSSYQMYNKVLNKVILETIQNYQLILTLRKLVLVQKINVDIASQSVEKAMVRVKTGAETKTSLFIAKTSLANTKSDLESFLIQDTNLAISFKYFVGINPPNNLKQINMRKYQKIRGLDTLELLTKNQNPDLIKVKNDLKASKGSVSIAASLLLPKVSLFINSSKTRSFSERLSLYEKDHKGSTYGIRIQIPVLYKGGIQYLHISEAKKKCILHEVAFNFMKDNVEKEMNKLWIQYIANKNIYKLARLSEYNCYQTYVNAQTEFHYGAKTLLEVINKQSDYNLSIIKRLQKEKDYKISLFEAYNIAGYLPKMIF